MNIFLVIALAMLLIIILLRRHIPIGPAILAGGLLIWALVAPSVPLSGQRLHHHAYHAAHLRPDPGALFCHVPGNRAAYQRRFRRNDPRPAALICQRKIYTGHYASFSRPAASLGGARFSAPIVEAASRNTDLTKEHKAAINFWFRHIFEFSSPIIPGMIMACSIAGVAFSDFIAHLCWLTLLAFALAGWCSSGRWICPLTAM